jgi:asparagine synthase (glutamine-hydrolysing)
MGTDEYRRGMQLLLAIGDIERFYLILRNTWDYDQGFYKEIYNPNYIDAVGASHAKLQTSEGFREFFSQVEGMNALDQVLYAEFHTKMVNDYLLVEDRMSMANSVEERVPFLDIDLVNFGFSIPVHLKIRNNQTKYLFRKAMEPHLPKGIIRKKKWGFTINPYLQFKKDLHEVASGILTEDFVRRQGIFNYDYLKKIMDHKPHPRMRWHYNYLWVVMGIAIWQKMFIETDNFRERRFELEEYFD